MDEKQKAFLEFERNGWERAASTYGDTAGVLTAQAAPLLLEAVGLSQGQRVLDVATGPGFVAAAAADRLAVPVGVDISRAMVAEASRLHPGIEFHEGPAEKLPFEDEEFDALVCAFGMPHFADHQAFLAEAHRVLRRGGLIAFATWEPPERNPLLGVIMEAIRSAGDANPVGLPDGPDFFAYAEEAHCRAVLEDAGFRQVCVDRESLSFPINDGARGLVRFIDATVRTRALYEAQSGEAKSRIIKRISELLKPYGTDGRAVLPARIVVVSAARS